MKKVLAISATMVAKEQSFSRHLLDAFVKEYKSLNPEDNIIFMDLNTLTMAKKTLTSENMGSYFSPEDSDQYIDQLKSVDKVIMAVPMTNFNITATAKNYLDHISVANKTFSYKYETSSGDAKGLLDHLKVQILTTQGAPFGWYPWGNHTKYLEGHWKFLGAKINPAVLIAGTKTLPLKTLSPAEAVAKYSEEIIKAVKTF